MKISTILFLIGVVGFVDLRSAEPRSPKPLDCEKATPPPVPPRKSDNPPALAPRSPKKTEAFESVIVEVGSNGKYSIPLEPQFSPRFDSVYEYDVPFGTTPPPMPMKGVIEKGSKKSSTPSVVAGEEEVFSNLSTLTEFQKNSVVTPKRPSSSAGTYMNTSPDSKGRLSVDEGLYLTPVINVQALEFQRKIKDTEDKLHKLQAELEKLDLEQAQKLSSKDEVIFKKRTIGVMDYVIKRQAIESTIDKLEKEKGSYAAALGKLNE